VNAPDDASGAPPVPGSSATFTNRGAWGCKRILLSDSQTDGYIISRCVIVRVREGTYLTWAGVGNSSAYLGSAPFVLRVNNPTTKVSDGTGGPRRLRKRKRTHHSPRTVLANIPAPSCGIGSTSTRRELRTSSEKAPSCVGENADTASVKSPSVSRSPGM